MKRLLLICIFCTLLFGTLQAIAAPPSTDYELLLADEFDGDALDTTIWDWRSGTPYGGPNLAENVRVKNGMLYLDYRKVDGLYSGGGVITNFNLPYGYYETRAKVYGGTAGLHSSFWISGGNSFTTRPENYPMNNTILEIDGFEIDSHAPARLSHGTIYWWNEREGRFRDYYTEQDFSEDYFVMGMEWLPDRVNFYLDGKLINTDDRLNVYGPGYFWLTAVATPESDWGLQNMIDDSKADETGYFGSSEYDYFRYYQIPLKNENLLGNGNFEYDRAGKSRYPFCYITKENTEASHVIRTKEAYEGLYCLRHASTTPYSVFSGQEFNYLLSGNYTFSGKFKATGDFTKARMVIYDKDGSVIAQKKIPSAEEWISLTLNDVYIDGYAYVAIESASEGNTELLIDDLSFYATFGDEYRLQNSPDYLLYTGTKSSLLTAMHDEGLISYEEITEKSENWSDNSSLTTDNMWAGQGNYAIWELPVTKAGTYSLDIHCLYADNNATSMQCSVSVNGGETTVHTVPTNTGKSYYYHLGTLELQEGDTITVRADATMPKATRLSHLRLMPISQYNAYTALTFLPDENTFLHLGEICEWGEFSPYKQDGKYYLPYAKLNEALGLNISIQSDYIDQDTLAENTPYRLTDSGNMVLLSTSQDVFDDSVLAFCRIETKKANISPTPVTATLLESDVSGGTVYTFSDSFSAGNWKDSSLDNGSKFSTGNAVALWECTAPKEGTYALQFRSVHHDNSTPFADIDVLTDKSFKRYTINQRDSETGWYGVGTYDLKENEKIVISLTNGMPYRCLRAKEIRLVPISSALPPYMGNETIEDAVLIPFDSAETAGNWTNSSIGNSFTSNATDAKATFTFTIPQSGRYNVQIFSASHTNGPQSASILYTTDADFSLFSINQQTADTGWYSVATRYFEKGETVSVSFRKTGSGYLRTRDIRLVPVPHEPLLLQSDTDVILGLKNHILPCDTVLLGEYDQNGHLVTVKSAPSASPVQFELENSENQFKLFFWDKKFTPLLENK
ncbi:MAG: family 16 glycosylhydrolase [Clostridia bacterium]|nr:family 16 glycosylhydrolase [Clostridia bacterium]